MAQLNSQVEALQYVDTVLRSGYGGELGGAELLSGEIIVDGHKAWRYHIEGLPMSRDGRQRWLLDTGETFDTTFHDSDNTPEKALAKLRKMQIISKQEYLAVGNERAKLQSVNLLLPEDVFSRNIDRGQLSAYIKELVAGINTILQSDNAECQLRIGVQLSPNESPKVEIDYQGSIENDSLQAAYDAITKIQSPAVAHDVLPFEVLISVGSVL
jgi:hypothetical protein